MYWKCAERDINMINDKWICKECGLYIKVDFNNIKIGDEVEFKIFIDNSLENYKFLKGVVNKKENNNFYVSSCSGLFLMSKNNLYPSDAPVDFIYNMFGTCFCS